MPIYAFTGGRKDFLDTKRPYYNACYDIGDAKNALANILRIYCRMYPFSMRSDAEATPEQIERALSDVQEEDEVELDENNFTSEEWKKIQREREVERLALLKLQGQLQRWFSYRYIKDCAVLQRTDSKNHAFANLFRRLEGTEKKPRLRSAINVWRHGFSRAVEEVARKEVEESGASLSRGLAGVRSRVGKEMFGALSQEDREHYQMLATEEHQGAMAAFEANKSLGPSTSPDDRQRCITALPGVVQPFLDALVEATGWRVSLIAGGPEPATNGQMSMVMVHSGTTIGDVKMDWGRFDHKRIPDVVMPMFGDFLRKCYSVAECHSRTLPADPIAEVTGTQQYPPAVPPHTTSVARPTPSSPTHVPEQIHAPPPLLPPIPPLATAPTPLIPPPEIVGASSASLSTPASPLSTTPPQTCPIPPTSPTRTPSHSRAVSPPTHSRSPSPMPSPSSPQHSPPPDTSPIVHTQPTAAQLIISSHLSHSSDIAAGKRPVEDPELEGEGGAGRKKQKTSNDPTAEGGMAHTSSVGAISTQTGVSSISTTSATGATSSTEQRPSSTVPVPTNNEVLPPWFVEAMDLFVKGCSGMGAGNVVLGEPWVACLEAYSLFQRTHGFGAEADKRLPARLRPTLVKDWVSRGRTRNKGWRPKNFVPKDFKLEFTAWWASLQPSWRVENDIVIISRVEGDWSCLLYPGVNGLLSVVAALFFWGLEKQDKAWRVAVADCTTAFTQLTATRSS